MTKMLGEMDSEAFQQWPPSLQFTKDWSYTQFVDIIVFCIARLFNPKVKRISEEMKQALQKEPFGDRFLRKEYSMMRIYGFTAAPYILPVFLTPTIFSLELIRQRIHADIEHFTSHKKNSWIKYPINIGSFIVKKEEAISIVEEMLKQMKFVEELALDYDPKGVISQRKGQFGRGEFIHCTITDLTKEANSLEYAFNWGVEEAIQVSRENQDVNPTVTLPSESKLQKKKSFTAE